MRKLLIIILISISIISCEDKFDLNSVISDNEAIVYGDTVYIQQTPDWGGFNKPQDMIVGREPFIYVADTENDRIVMLDIAGQFLGSKQIQKPTSITQDYALNLIVVGEFDTLINGNALTFSAVYKIDLVSSSHNLQTAPVRRLLPQDPKDDPFAFNRPDRIYTGITSFFDNSYYVSRKGPSNSNPVDRDNGIVILRDLSFDNGFDTLLVSKVPLLEAEGTGLLSANQISSVTAFNKRSLDVILTLIGENSFKVQWLQYVSNTDFTGYQNKLEAFASDLMQVDKFSLPEDVCLDDAENIYVADAEKDSIFKFNSFGDELESFGGADLFDSPHAVAYHDKTLYVLDTNNDRILRFVLSTDIE